MALFGRTGGGLFNLINKQMPAILNSRNAYARTQSLDKSYDQTKDNFFGRKGQMRAAWQDFAVAAGTKGGLLDGMTSGLRMATGALRALTGAANAHPTAFRWIVTGITALLGMKLATSAVKFAFGGLLGPVGRLWGLWSRYRALGSVAAMFPRLARGMGMLRRAAGMLGPGILRGAGIAGRGVGMFVRALAWLRGAAVAGFMRAMPLLARGFGIARTAALMLGKGVVRAGLMMLGNPIVLTITAIVAALAIAGYLIYTHWDTIKAAFWKGVAWVKETMGALPSWLKNLGSMAMQGLLMALNPALMAARLVSIAKAGVTAFKNYFGIKSPSRLMIAMGGHINEGLAVGVDRTGGRPMQAVARMAAAVASASAVTLPAPVMAEGHLAANRPQAFGNMAPAAMLPSAMAAAQSRPASVAMPAPVVTLQSRPAPVGMRAPAVMLQSRPLPVAMPTPAVMLRGRPAPLAMRAPAVMLQSRPGALMMRAPAVVLQSKPSAVMMRAPSVLLQGRPAPVRMLPPTVLAQSRMASLRAIAPPVMSQGRAVVPKAFTLPPAGQNRIAAARPMTIAPKANPRPIRDAPPPAKIEIHIHQQPGEDTEALLRRMMAMMKQEQRRAGRSQLADDF